MSAVFEQVSAYLSAFLFLIQDQGHVFVGFVAFGSIPVFGTADPKSPIHPDRAFSFPLFKQMRSDLDLKQTKLPAIHTPHLGAVYIGHVVAVVIDQALGRGEDEDADVAAPVSARVVFEVGVNPAVLDAPYRMALVGGAHVIGCRGVEIELSSHRRVSFSAHADCSTIQADA